mmetsp:Transcript_15959/g.62352  ORF Transcript_15959/g.62352 Transcript_15959/m.62352 type:complete len:374 (+) Transcript_15959:50-1171(+)
MAAAAAAAARARGALWAALIGDALSMPVHWYYDTSAIDRDFGEIRGYRAPKEVHPTSIMHCSSTGGGGRGTAGGQVVGKVILHDKAEFWGGKNRGIHYHRGMQAGENTLTSRCARILLRTIAEAGGVYEEDRFLEDYVKFMTTPGTHNDTYADSFHREFFLRFGQGLPPRKCVGPEMSDTAQIGGLVMLIPVITSVTLSSVKGKEELTADEKNDAVTAAEDAAVRQLRLTHNSEKLERNAKTYARMLSSTLLGDDLRAVIDSNESALGLPMGPLVERGLDDRQVAGGIFGIACYIDDALRVVAYLSHKYAEAPAEGLFANTRCGGENCQRGACVGALLGAANGYDSLPSPLVNGLHAAATVRTEVEAFLAAHK